MTINFPYVIWKINVISQRSTPWGHREQASRVCHSCLSSSSRPQSGLSALFSEDFSALTSSGPSMLVPRSLNRKGLLTYFCAPTTYTVFDVNSVWGSANICGMWEWHDFISPHQNGYFSLKKHRFDFTFLQRSPNLASDQCSAWHFFWLFLLKEPKVACVSGQPRDSTDSRAVICQ